MIDTTIFCNKCGQQSAPEAPFCTRCGSSLVLPRTQAVFQRMRSEPAYAGFWIRSVAAFIDFLIVFAAMMPVRWIIYFPAGFMAMSRPRSFGASTHASLVGITMVVSVLLSWCYEAYFLSSNRQATPGKMALGLKVTDLNGQRISFDQATGRHFAKYLSRVILLIGYIMAAFTERKRALHDIIAGTLVLRR